MKWKWGLHFCLAKVKKKKKRCICSRCCCELLLSLTDSETWHLHHNWRRHHKRAGWSFIRPVRASYPDFCFIIFSNSYWEAPPPPRTPTPSKFAVWELKGAELRDASGHSPPPADSQSWAWGSLVVNCLCCFGTAKPQKQQIFWNDFLFCLSLSCPRVYWDPTQLNPTSTQEPWMYLAALPFCPRW